MKTVTVYTDGACKGNPGPGGWAVILSCCGQKREYSGGDYDTTNNAMELTAVLEAVKRCYKAPANIVVHTDSTYVMADDKKLEKWMMKPDLPNRDLWQKLIDEKKAHGHKLSFVHVDGHSGDPMNERCDTIAKGQAAEFARKMGWKPKSCREEIELLMQEELMYKVMELERRRKGVVPE